MQRRTTSRGCSLAGLLSGCGQSTRSREFRKDLDPRALDRVVPWHGSQGSRQWFLLLRRGRGLRGGVAEAIAGRIGVVSRMLEKRVVHSIQEHAEEPDEHDA